MTKNIFVFCFFALLLSFFFSCRSENKQNSASTTDSQKDSAKKVISQSFKKDTTWGIDGMANVSWIKENGRESFQTGNFRVIFLQQSASSAENVCYVCKRGEKDSFQVKVSDAPHRFFGGYEDLIFFECGTSTTSELVIYSVSKKEVVDKFLYTDDLRKDFQIKDGKLTYRAILSEKDAKKVKSTCPDAKEWQKKGLKVGYAELKSLDFKTLKVAKKGAIRCVPMQ